MTSVTAAEAVSRIESGMSVAFPHLSAEPTVLTEALWQRAENLSDLTVYSGMLLSGYGFLKSAAAKNIRFKTWFMPGTLLRKTASDVKAEYLPLTWAQTARFLNSVSMDVALIQVSPADADGYHSVGVNSTVSMALVKHSKLVIAQVNPLMPRTLGDARVHASELDLIVEEESPLIEYPHRPADEVDAEIGRLIADMVPDGAALQLGIGGLPGAVAEALVKRGVRDLTMISLLTDPTRELIDAGCCRSENPKAFVGDILGTRALYDWCENNPAVAMADALSTHTVEALVKRPNLFAINSALEVDLFGQLNSETLGGKQAGAMGGSVDFAIGGQVEGATSVIGLRSTTGKGASRIVSQLDSGLVSISRTFVQYVVTEYGVANLTNKSVPERAVALAQIAHPDHRDALMAKAAELG